MGRIRKRETAEMEEQQPLEQESIVQHLISQIVKRSSSVPSLEVEHIQTGVVPFDTILGGFPVGHITLLSGMPASGKTLLVLHAVASHVLSGGNCLYLDTEGSVTEQRLDTVGIPSDLLEKRLFVRSYVVLEDCLSDVKNLLWRLRDEPPDKPFLVVIDSLSSLLPHKWLKEDTEVGFLADLAVGGYARSGTAFLAGLPHLLKESRCALVITTQVRAEISMGGRGPSIKPFKFFALEHLSHTVLFLGAPEMITPPFIAEVDDSEKLVGVKGYYSKVKVTMRKSQLPTPQQRVIPPTFDFSLFYPIVDVPSLGIKAGKVDNIFSILTYASLPQIGVVEKVVKPGVGTIFYYQPDNRRVVQFSYIDAYTNSAVRELVEGEIGERLKLRIEAILTAQTKGKSHFKEEIKGDMETL